MDEYRVKLDTYNGPLDLLLHLVRRQEVDISEVSLARITDDYLRYLDMLTALQVDVAGEFLVMAATLMDIKSRTLLPAPEIEEEEDWEDPSEELVRQLMEYRRFKEAAVALEDHQEDRSLRVGRPGEKVQSESENTAEAESIDVSVWDLVEAFGRVLQATGQAATSFELTYDDTPQEVVMERIMSRFRSAQSGELREEVPLTEFAREGLSRAIIISLLLAILELVKLGKIRAVQHEPFGQIFLKRRESSDPNAAPGRTADADGEIGPAQRPADDSPQPE